MGAARRSMMDFGDNEAAKPNPALKSLSVLVGEWKTSGTHPLVPGKTFHGRTSFSWMAGGAFLLMQSRVDEPEIPSGIAVFGTDDTNGDCTMLYFDERDVSRRYEVSVQGNVCRWWRNNAEFSQRSETTIAPDGRTMISRGEYSRNGGRWEPDLELSFIRLD